jgi:uncharacterized LabA/DUF88 family protein
MRTYFYVDGFNLYYRALKGTSAKWLDLMALFRRVLQPHHRIKRIKYFTARVTALNNDPRKPLRQDVYLRALQAAIPEVEIYFGHFLTHPVWAPLAAPGESRRFVEVLKTEEKGSDVNLAVHLINDAWLDRYDCAVIVSNDSDLAEAMRLVKLHHPRKRLGLVTPGKSHPSRELLNHVDFSRHIRSRALGQSQLPDPIPGTNIRKPKVW